MADEWFADLRSVRHVSVSTVRGYQVAIRGSVASSPTPVTGGRPSVNDGSAPTPCRWSPRSTVPPLPDRGRPIWPPRFTPWHQSTSPCPVPGLLRSFMHAAASSLTDGSRWHTKGMASAATVGLLVALMAFFARRGLEMRDSGHHETSLRAVDRYVSAVRSGDPDALLRAVGGPRATRSRSAICSSVLAPA